MICAQEKTYFIHIALWFTPHLRCSRFVDCVSSMRLFIFAVYIINTIHADVIARSFPVYEHHLLPRQNSCLVGQVVCSSGGCCPEHSVCTVLSGIPGCCPAGASCATSALTTPTATATPTDSCSAGYSPCNDSMGGCCPVDSQVNHSSTGWFQCVTQPNGLAGCSVGLLTTGSSSLLLSSGTSFPLFKWRLTYSDSQLHEPNYYGFDDYS